jgi:ribonuclease R
VLLKKPGDTVTDLQLQSTASAIARGRGATQAAERWLTGNYLDRCKSSGETRYTGEIAHVTSAGFTVRLAGLGLEGQVDLRKDPEKFSFDKWTASLTSSTRKLQLGQTVEVDYQSTPDAGSGTAPQFELAPGCALKPAKE